MAINKTDLLQFEDEFYQIIPPAPSETDRGGIVASAKTSADTIEAKLGNDGKLYVKPTDLTNYYEKDELDSIFVDMQTFAENAANEVKNDLLNGAGDAYDTLGELGVLIDENKDAIDALREIATNKADKNHNHNDLYYTGSEIDSMLIGKSDADHTHDDRYYTESEMNSKLAEKSDVTHNHNDVYETKSDAIIKFNEATSHTNTEIELLSSQVAFINAQNNETVVDGVVSGGTGNISVDTVLSTTSANPVQNKVVTSKINEIQNSLNTHKNTTDIHVTSAEKEMWNNKSEFSGAYGDLTGLPTIPTNVSQLTNDIGYISSIPSEYVTDSELNAKGYITSIPSEYVTESELTGKGYLTSIPSEYITETELNAKGYLTKAPTEVAVQNNEPTEGVLWIDADSSDEIILAEIDDNTVSDEKTWSSTKLNAIQQEKVDKTKFNKNGLDYGVVGDGSTDDSAAINALLASGWTTVYLPKKTYKISSPIVLSARYTEFICDGTIVYDGEDSAIKIMHNNSSINVYQINATNGTAIKIDSTEHKVYGINVKCKFISAKIGLHLYANAKEINYGIYDIDTISATEIPIKAESVGQSILIHEHKFNLVSLQGESLAPYGVYLYGVNCCRFLSGGVENLGSEAVALYLENSEYNTFDNFRMMENYGSKRLKLVGYCRCNNFKFSYCKFTEVDYCELDYSSGRTGINRFYGELSPDGSYHIGDCAEITEHGIIYDIIKSNPTAIVLMEGYYSDKDIKMISTGHIPSVFKCNKSALNGTTWTLNEIYNYGCLSGGNPITFVFGGSNGKMTLKDNQGNTIIDNSNGDYLGKTVIIQSFGVDDSGVNVWDVRVLKENYATVEQVEELIGGAIGGSY